MREIFTNKFDPVCNGCNRLLMLGFTLLLFSAHSSAGTLNLAWDASASPDAAGYKIHYGQTSSNYTSTIDAGNKTSYTMDGLAEGGKYFFAVTAYDSGRTTESEFSNEATATVAPVATSTLDFTPSKTIGVAPLIVTFTPKASGTVTGWKWDFGLADLSASTSQIPTVTFAKAGTYTVKLTTTGASGNATATKQITVAAQTPALPSAPIATNPSQPTPPKLAETVASNLVAAYGFEEIGPMAVDASGKGNHGIIKEAISIPAGRYGKALKFDGVNDVVTVKDSPSLDLSSGLTLEAWVYPSAIKPGTVILKEQPKGAVYNLYSSEDADLPISSFNDGANYNVVSSSKQLPINQWSHLVATYDGQNQRLYVNGIQASARAQQGKIKSSNGVLRIGGNAIWGEYFKGYIDEVKIYNRALTDAEIQKDLTTAIKVSNPALLVVGNNTLEPSVAANPPGIAEAFKSIPTKNAVVTALQVYLDASSKASSLVAGIYIDNNGHPGKLIAQGKLNTLKAGATNTVPVTPAALVAAKPYWIAILSQKGEIKFRNRLGSGAEPQEKSAAKNLTTLPKQWATGAVYPNDGSMSVYGSGY